MKEVMDTVNSVECQSDVLSSVMCDAEQEWLGYEDRHHLDWFREIEVDIVMEENQGLHLVTLVVTIYGGQQLMCVCVSTRAVCMRVCDNDIYCICAVHSCLT